MRFQNDPEFRKDVKNWAKEESKQPEEYYLSEDAYCHERRGPYGYDFLDEFCYKARMKASSLLLPSTYCIPELKLELWGNPKYFREMLEKSGDPLLRDFDREVEDVRRRLSPLTHRTVWARRGANISEKISKKIKDWFKQKQYLLNPKAKLPKWPRLTVSDDAPPAFRENPWMKKLYDEDQEGFNFEMPSDTESLLGVYLWKTKEIIIWRKGVEFCARAKYQLNGGEVKALYEDIYTCVLVHEMGHWFNAEAITPGNVPWNTAELEISTRTKIEEPPCNPDHNIPGATVTYPLAGNARSLSSRSYHEAWAQWFAWLYGQEVDAAAGVAMAVLNPRQSEPYHAWKKLVDNNTPSTQHKDYSLNDLAARWPKHMPHVQQRILQSLEWSRQLTDSAGNPVPATFDDKNYPERNMLGWL